ncbi:Ig-like domain repeat protein [Nocardia sp. NPDC057668]|uniref:Ig-like domain repeat protein n=1 Tax=Nocardia sp. NPDC057668 TaxID=3346202 RepID=UPI0036718400
MHAFDPNDYRKRVLAAVERRGGVDASDPFELYDIPLDEAEQLTDAQVGARVDEVWAFWQKQRDHPKYRVLVGLLVDGHEECSEPLLSAASRRVEAERVRRTRDRRDSERYEMLDSAIERLVQRHGGIPVGKIAGLEDLGKLGGLDPKEIEARLRRHRRIEDAATPAPAARTSEISTQRRQQIRKLLAEYERLLPGDPVPTLLVLLRLDFTKAHETSEIRLRAEALRSRTRELPPGRIRVVLDELLVHISDVLEAGGDIVDDYLAAIVEDVTETLRPQVRAAVLVEDHLVAGDFEYLVGEAITAGLDRIAAETVIIGLVTELGTTVEGRERGVDSIPGHRGSGNRGSANRASGAASGSAAGTSAGGGSSRYTHPGRGAGSPARTPVTPASGRTPTGPPIRAWEAPLKAARAALRAGRPFEASQRVDEAKLAVGGDSAGNTAVRPVAEEVDRVLAEAALRWRSAASGCDGRRYVDALEHLEFLSGKAADVPNPDGRGPRLEQLLAQARNAMSEADRLFAAAPAAPAAARMRALLSVLDLCADHTGATAALAELPVDAPGKVSATRKPDGTVVVAWSPSVTEQVEYRVTRLQSDGSWRVVGRTRTTALEDGGASTGPVPVYGVVASISGRASAVSRSDGPAAEPDRSAAGAATSNFGGATGAMPRTTDASGAAARTTGSHPDAASSGPRSGGFDAAAARGPAVSDTPSGMPAVRGLTANAGLLTFEWPAGITEVMVVARADAPPTDPDDPAAVRKWKVTNTRYQIDGGAKLPADVPRPCHIGVASCRREPTGTLTVAAGFAPAARIHVTG